jgi:hypothetical protein
MLGINRRAERREQRLAAVKGDPPDPPEYFTDEKREIGSPGEIALEGRKWKLQPTSLKGQRGCLNAENVRGTFTD